MRGRAPLRLVVWDATEVAPLRLPRVTRREDGTAEGTGGLSRWWRLGAGLHRGLYGADAVAPASTWDEALRFAIAASDRLGAKIAELQAWGHGGFGFMRMGDTRLDRASLAGGAALAPLVDALRDRLADDALVWLRCCSAFGAAEGRAFAPALAERLRARVAAHTFIIGAWQSGTHSVALGEAPSWPIDEGTERTASGAIVARVSRADAPNTVFMLRRGLPAGW
jgi:hypothetical protein